MARRRNRVNKAGPSADALAAQAGQAQMAGGPSDPNPQAAAGFGMYGISGLTRYGAISRVYEEFLRELQGPAGMRSYREMRDNCPIVGAIMFAAEHLTRRVSFKFTPKDSSNEARRIADFVGGAIFDDMSASWPDTLSEILTMLPFGWALMEFSVKRRLGMGRPNLELPPWGQWDYGAQGLPDPDGGFIPSRFSDGLIGFREWSLRSQETLFMWEFDSESHPLTMQQMPPPDYKIRRIPLSKCLHFRTQVSKGNPEGRSVLRNAWTSYYFKKNLQVFEGIGVERDLAGYPVIQIAKPDLANGLPVPDIWNPKDADAVSRLSELKRLVRSVRRDEQEGMVLPWWAEFKLLSTGSRRSFNTNDIIARYDQRIAMSVMADFIMLGHEAVGSKALAATKISLFTSALSSFMDNACAIINRQAVPFLLQVNGMPLGLAPTLTHGDVESINIQELGEFISKVAGTGFNPLATFDAQKAVMEAARLPVTGMTPTGTVGAVGDRREGGTETGGTAPPLAPEASSMGQPDNLSIT